MQITCFRLADGVHAAAVDEDLVFLNIAADSYFCLPNAEPQARLASPRRSLEVENAQLVRDLLDAGLIVEGPPSAGSSWTPPRPTGSAVPHDHGAATLRDLPEISRSVWDVLRHYRSRTFAEILAAAPPHAPEARTPPPPELLQVLTNFHRWIPYAPVSGKCLLRSFALLRFLRRHGHDAQWVFGVSTWPFRAHCWLQRGEVALDDTVERLRAFEPILVV